MIVLIQKGNALPGTIELEDGDHVTPQLLCVRGYRFPSTILRFTFKDGPYYSSGGAPLVQTERWPKDMQGRVKANRSRKEAR